MDAIGLTELMGLLFKGICRYPGVPTSSNAVD